MRYFPVIAWAGRLQQRDAVSADVWSPSRTRFETEETVDRILSMMLTDRKIRSLEEIDAAVGASAQDQISRVLWVPEDLLGEVRQRVLRQAT